MMTQTAAIFLDAYRELNAKKLFWIVLALSGVVVLAFAAVGIDEEGLSIFAWHTESDIFNTNIVPKDVFYKGFYTTLGIGLWLGWFATILALVSTAGIFPEFISSGSIELVLSRPLGRLRLFVTKYLAGLLFVTLQVGLFAAASFLVIGIRGGAWEPGLFWAVPLTVCFFSYLFGVCVLLGMLTRSTVASLLLTLLVWFAVFGVNATEQFILGGLVANETKIEVGEEYLSERKERLAALEATPEDERVNSHDRQVARLEERIENVTEDLEKARGTAKKWKQFHVPVFAFKTLLPKTDETKALIERILISQAELEGGMDEENAPPMLMRQDSIPVSGIEVNKRYMERLRSRSVTWVVGTSLAFEAVMLALAAWIFCRRDF